MSRWDRYGRVMDALRRHEVPDLNDVPPALSYADNYVPVDAKRIREAMAALEPGTLPEMEAANA